MLHTRLWRFATSSITIKLDTLKGKCLEAERSRKTWFPFNNSACCTLGKHKTLWHVWLLWLTLVVATEAVSVASSGADRNLPRLWPCTTEGVQAAAGLSSIGLYSLNKAAAGNGNSLWGQQRAVWWQEKCYRCNLSLIYSFSVKAVS